MRPVLAYGGGVNSTALAILLIEQGWRGIVAFCNTGAEWPETYWYVWKIFRPFLESNEVEFVLIGKEYRSRRYRPPMPVAARLYKMIPLARARWCTSEYKIDPFRRWCKRHGFDFENDVMVAISADEAHRQPNKVRPLVEWGISRDNCARIIADAGLPIPRKSGCWMCPFQRRGQWMELYLRYPRLFRQALYLEHLTGCTFDPHGEHRLEQYVFQPVLFDFSEYYQPCMCRV